MPSLGGLRILQQILGAVSFLVGSVVVIETLNAGIFDYYFPDVKRLEAPQIFRQLFVVILSLCVLFVFLVAVLRVNLTPLLTTSAVISIVIGLALQDTLGNLFSGLAMQLSRPYSLGDWVKFGETVGCVEKIDWRSVSIRTFAGDRVILPHSTLAKTEVHNFTSPDRLYARQVKVHVHYRHQPSMVKRVLLEVAQSAKGVLQDPPPVVWLTSFDDFAKTYTLKFWVADFCQYLNIESAVMERIWYRFSREGIEIPFPIFRLYIEKRVQDVDSRLEKFALLRGIDFLKGLSEESIAYLAERLKIQLYTPGEIIFRQGEPGETFYIIRRGRAELK